MEAIVFLKAALLLSRPGVVRPCKSRESKKKKKTNRHGSLMDSSIYLIYSNLMAIFVAVGWFLKPFPHPDSSHDNQGVASELQGMPGHNSNSLAK